MVNGSDEIMNGYLLDGDESDEDLMMLLKVVVNEELDVNVNFREL